MRAAPAAVKGCAITLLSFASLKESASLVLVPVPCMTVCLQLSAGLCLLTSGRAVGFREQFLPLISLFRNNLARSHLE